MHNLPLQQTLLCNCPSQLLLQGQPLPSGPDMLPLQQRQAALQSLVTSACADMMLSQQPMGKVDSMLQLLSGVLHLIDDPLAAAVVFVAGVVAHVAVTPRRCQLLLKK
jgi:hypothetical protein